MKRSRIKRKPTNRSEEGKRAMDEFKAAHIGNGKRCWLCEREPATERHHIVPRRGKMYDDPRDLLAVCITCHRRAEGRPQTLVGGRVLPVWTYDDVLRAKQRHDQDNYDPEFLDRLAHPERELRRFFNVNENRS